MNQKYFLNLQVTSFRLNFNLRRSKKFKRNAQNLHSHLTYEGVMGISSYNFQIITFWSSFSF